MVNRRLNLDSELKKKESEVMLMSNLATVSINSHVQKPPPDLPSHGKIDPAELEFSANNLVQFVP